MGTKMGLVIGFGAGYVLGAKAGRERYAQIQRWWGQFSGSPAVQRVTEKTKGAAGAGARRGLHAVQRGVDKAGSAVKDRLHHDEDPNEELIERFEEQSGRAPEATPETLRKTLENE
jgi:hypothetical protein